MTNLAKIKRLYLWKPSICKTFWTTLLYTYIIMYMYGGGNVCGLCGFMVQVFKFSKW